MLRCVIRNLLWLCLISINGAQIVSVSDVSSTPLYSWPMILTHDAATGYLDWDPVNPVWPWARTQPQAKAAFETQLNCGARAFDFRPRLSDGKLTFHHGKVGIDHDVSDSLREIISWANKHPSIEDLVIIYISKCLGGGCEDAVSTALVKANITKIADCSEVMNLTVGTAAEKGKLVGGGSVLALDGCVDENYVAENACSGFDGPKAEGPVTSDTVLQSCDVRSGHIEDLVSCGQQLRTQKVVLAPREAQNDHNFAYPEGYYHCWNTSSTNDFPLQRLMKYLKGVASASPESFGQLQMMQAIWEETKESIVIGEACFSSLLKDEQRSNLNRLMAQAVKNGTFPHISLFEVNNVCDSGLDLLQALRDHHQSKLTEVHSKDIGIFI